MAVDEPTWTVPGTPRTLNINFRDMQQGSMSIQPFTCCAAPVFDMDTSAGNAPAPEQESSLAVPGGYVWQGCWALMAC